MAVQPRIVVHLVASKGMELVLIRSYSVERGMGMGTFCKFCNRSGLSLIISAPKSPQKVRPFAV